MKVHAIQTGTVAVKSRQREGKGRGPARLANTFIDRSWTEPLPIFAWLIEHPEGLIVVDTGETSRVADRGYFPWWQPYFKLGVREWVAPEDEIGPRIKALGLSPDDVRWRRGWSGRRSTALRPMRAPPVRPCVVSMSWRMSGRWCTYLRMTLGRQHGWTRGKRWRGNHRHE
jgi:hypothetical protein